MNVFTHFERNTPFMIMLCGLPASGKSEYAKSVVIENEKKTSKPIIHSSDALRKELYGDESVQGDNNKLFRILHSRIKKDLARGNDVIYDATNINKKQRVHFLNELKDISCTTVCVCVMTTLEMCLENNKNRERCVPNDVLHRMFLNWQPPHYNEGFKEIRYLYSCPENLSADNISDYDFTFRNYFKVANRFDQENSHHKLTLGNHCTMAANYIQKHNNDNFNLLIAAMLHDNGKLHTKTRLNKKGVDDGDCHYYQHHCCGAYYSLFYLDSTKKFSAEDKAYISNLIYYHMHPYTTWKQSSKALNRDRKLIGEQMYGDILQLHEADLYAH